MHWSITYDGQTMIIGGRTKSLVGLYDVGDISDIRSHQHLTLVAKYQVSNIDSPELFILFSVMFKLKFGILKT